MSKTISIVTPDNVEIEYKLASVGVRAAAAGIDMLIQSIVFLIIGGTGAWIIWKLELDMEAIYMYIGGMLLLFALINYGYFIVCDMVMKGQTIGKRIYNIRIIRENGEGIALSHAIIREFMRATIDPLGIGVIMIFLNKKNKRIGDLAASTIVVEEEKRSSSYLENIYNPLSQYDLTTEEISLLQDYLSRKDQLEEDSKTELQLKLVKYFKERFDIHDIILDGDRFLKSLFE